MSAFHFPKPGERKNVSAIPVPEDVLVWLCSAAEVLMHLDACFDPMCVTCAHKHSMIERALSLLPRETQDLIVMHGRVLADTLRERLA